MKKIIVFALLLIISATSFSQPVSNPVPTAKTDYLQKSKNQKTTAWVMLGGGATFILLGDLIGNSKGSSFSDAATGAVIAGLGVLSMVGSIPLFLASGKNKRKANAMSASIRMENTDVIQGLSMVHNSYPALSIKINL